MTGRCLYACKYTSSRIIIVNRLQTKKYNYKDITFLSLIAMRSEAMQRMEIEIESIDHNVTPNREKNGTSLQLKVDVAVKLKEVV